MGAALAANHDGVLRADATKQGNHPLISGNFVYPYPIQACPGISRDMVRADLRAMQAEELVTPTGKGRSPTWEQLQQPIFFGSRRVREPNHPY